MICCFFIFWFILLILLMVVLVQDVVVGVNVNMVFGIDFLNGDFF